MRWRGRRGSDNVEDRRGMGKGSRSAAWAASAAVIRARPAHGRRPDVDARLGGGRRQRPHAGTAGRGRAVRLRRPRRHRGRLAAAVPQDGPHVPGAEAGPVHGLRRVGLRHGVVRGRPVLLPGRPQGLHRPRVLPRARASASARPATSPRPTSSPTRSATTSRTCSASATRSTAAAARQPDGGQRALGAPRAAGRLPRRRLGALRRRDAWASSSRATSRRRWARPTRSATTRCSARARATSCRTRSRTAPRPSACAGSGWATRPATWRRGDTFNKRRASGAWQRRAHAYLSLDVRAG